MRRNIRLIIIVIGTCLFLLPLFGIKASASEFNFTVKTVIPDNQINKKQTYFNLFMEPSQKQTIVVELRNDTDKDVTVLVDINSAITNKSGVVEYGRNDVELDGTLKYDMGIIITTDSEVVVPANGNYMLKLNINMPEEEFDGIIAGGIRLKEKVDEENSSISDSESGMSIKKEFAYEVAILLRVNENKLTPKLQLNDVFPNQINFRNVISANIQNTKAMYMNNMTVEAKVTKKADNIILYEENKEGIQMAPNSNFSFPISLNGKKMKAGEYTLKLTATSMKETWTWTKDFTIEKEEAKTFNAADVSLQNDYSWLVYVVIGMGILLMVLILWMILSKGKNNKEKNESGRYMPQDCTSKEEEHKD